VAVAAQRVSLQFLPMAPVGAIRGSVPVRRRRMPAIARALLHQAVRLRDALAMVMLAAVLCAGGVIGLAGLYMAKRAAGLNLFPSIDMLPDEAIEGAIHTVQHALLLYP
jgi:hypothetical protein